MRRAAEEKEEEARKWREEMFEFCNNCLETMRGFVPPHIFESTLKTLSSKFIIGSGDNLGGDKSFGSSFL